MRQDQSQRTTTTWPIQPRKSHRTLQFHTPQDGGTTPGQLNKSTEQRPRDDGANLPRTHQCVQKRNETQRPAVILKNRQQLQDLTPRDDGAILPQPIRVCRTVWTELSRAHRTPVTTPEIAWSSTSSPSTNNMFPSGTTDKDNTTAILLKLLPKKKNNVSQHTQRS